jgi:hypothetical protein
MKSQQKKTLAKKPRRSNMDDTITITGGSGTDSLTTSDTITLDLGGYGAAQSTWGSTPLTAISIDDILPSASVTLPSTYSIATGGTGTTWTTTGTGGYAWTNPYPTNVHINADGLTMKEGADIKIGGKSLTEAIEKIEERLGILNPNPALEDRWEKLKELRNQYIELEKDLLEKEKIMKILKET